MTLFFEENYFLNKQANIKQVLAKSTKLIKLIGLAETTMGIQVILNTTANKSKRQPTVMNNLVRFIMTGLLLSVTPLYESNSIVSPQR